MNPPITKFPPKPWFDEEGRYIGPGPLPIKPLSPEIIARIQRSEEKKETQKEKRRAYYEANKEKILARSKVYRAKRYKEIQSRSAFYQNKKRGAEQATQQAPGGKSPSPPLIQ